MCIVVLVLYVYCCHTCCSICVYCIRVCCAMCELLYWCVAVFTVDVELLARSRYSEGPATGHLDTGFSWFPCVYKQLLRQLPRFQVATTCFSCSPPDLNLNLSLTSFILCLHVKQPLPPGDSPIAVYYYYYYYYIAEKKKQSLSTTKK